MMPQGNLLLLGLALGLFLMLARALTRLAATTQTVQARRRLRRNYGRVASRTRRRPAVMLSVRTAGA